MRPEALFFLISSRHLCSSERTNSILIFVLLGLSSCEFFWLRTVSRTGKFSTMWLETMTVYR